ncbi:DUF1934 domain-containing protein [Bacillus salacetis]|uniref:DUF1934 domain-containing protein n=1 Tax=Bacillus salacetis TaxID=2315464 RepID=A0A3A1QT30_9BACI|nr:DUF1934 domain-containing protein [Bacillus salacetis]RIW27848.1 DUF1934 domain-containing protein [Bacillus salacetis]
MSGLKGGGTEHTDVKVHLKTRIQHGGEKDSFELYANGRYYEKGDSLYLKYDEVQEEGTIHTIFKLKRDEEALILRSGAVKMRMVFKEDEEHAGSYESQLGTLMITTKTSKLTHTANRTKNDGEINLSYRLYMQGSPVGEYEMDISYKEEGLE